MPGLLGGFALSHGSRTIKVGGVSINAKSCKWSASIDGEKMLYGTSKKPVARTSGVFKPETFELEIFRDDLPILKGVLTAASLGKGMLFAVVPIIVGSSELPAGLPQFDTIVGARFTKIDDSSSEGGDPILVKCTGTFMDITLNGVPLAISLPF